MDHVPLLVAGSESGEFDYSGHTLMASCPPSSRPETLARMPFGHGPRHAGGSAQATWDLSMPLLANLMDLSKRLNLDGEITPVMAWGMILSHARFADLTMADVDALCADLGKKVRCYGFVQSEW